MCVCVMVTTAAQEGGETDGELEWVAAQAESTAADLDDTG